jgi:hypothetical protein
LREKEREMMKENSFVMPIMQLTHHHRFQARQSDRWAVRNTDKLEATARVGQLSKVVPGAITIL